METRKEIGQALRVIDQVRGQSDEALRNSQGRLKEAENEHSTK